MATIPNFDRTQPIRELQTYLRIMMRVYPTLPSIMIDGIFGPETAIAVREYQRVSGLEQTGIVDFQLWERLHTEALTIERLTFQPIPPIPFPSETHRIQPGDNGQLVYVVQLIINTLAQIYGNFPILEVTGVYTVAVQQAVAQFQQTAGLNPTGTVDRATWNALSRAYYSTQNR